MLDVSGEVVFLREVPEDDYVEDGTKERDNHLFCPNIDAMKKQEQLHPEKIILKVLHIRHFYFVKSVQWLIYQCGICFVNRYRQNDLQCHIEVGRKTW